MINQKRINEVRIEIARAKQVAEKTYDVDVKIFCYDQIKKLKDKLIDLIAPNPKEL
jgi:hypothetical protein